MRPSNGRRSAGSPANHTRSSDRAVKRILSLDGGGIRGVFSLQVLAAIEALFRRERGRDDLVLADEYDLFAGTSTGAIIATCLAWGMSVREIEELYLCCGSLIFTKERWYNRWKSKYRAEPITQLFLREFTEAAGGREPALLGSARLRTLLLIVMRNATTGSPWPVTNNPHAAYNGPSLPGCNLRIPLWQLLRGSTAAPSYFPPEKIRLGDQSFLFVDGAITPFNNPTLIAVFMATIPAYRPVMGHRPRAAARRLDRNLRYPYEAQADVGDRREPARCRAIRCSRPDRRDFRPAGLPLPGARRLPARRAAGLRGPRPRFADTAGGERAEIHLRPLRPAARGPGHQAPTPAWMT